MLSPLTSRVLRMTPQELEYFHRDRHPCDLFEMVRETLDDNLAHLHARDARNGMVFASMCGHVSLVQKMIRWGYPINQLNDHDRRPLDVATDSTMKSLLQTFGAR